MATQKISVRKAREGLRRLFDQARAGDEVIVLRRGVEVGRIVPPRAKVTPLPDLRGFRASVKVRGGALSKEIREARRSSRY